VGDDEDGEFNWTDFYRAQFKEIINSDAIERFKKEYQGSEEEKMAVIESYVMNEGDLDAVYEEVMLSNPLDDDERYRAIIDAEIDAKRVEAYDAYTKETKASKRRRKENAKKEEEEAEEAAKELGVHDQLFGGGDSKKKAKGKSKENDTTALASLIQQRQKQRSEDFFADLEAKYAPKKGTKNAKRRAADEPPEIPEEAFERTEKNRKSKKVRILEEEEEMSSPRKTKRVKR
jgi:DnaJ homolog subfamily C member 9